VTHIGPIWLLLVLLAAPDAPPVPGALPERQLVIRGETPAEIHIAAGQSSVLLFDAAPVPTETRIEGVPVPLLVTEQGVVLFPSRNLQQGEESVLSVSLVDGTRLRLSLVSRPGSADLRVRIHRAPPPNSVEDLRARLERCEGSPQGVEAVARYLLEHGSLDGIFSPRSASKPVSPSRKEVTLDRAVDDRASGISYLRLRLTPSQPFAVLRVRLTDAGGNELRVLRVLPESLSLAAGELAAMVIAYEPGSGSDVPILSLHGADERVLELIPTNGAPAQ